MSVSHAARVRGTERRFVDDPDSAVAAWHLGMPDGSVLLTINLAMSAMPGAREYTESWFRLQALARGRPFAIMPVAELVLFGPLVVGHQHAAVG
jgi:hypothetical protein